MMNITRSLNSWRAVRRTEDQLYRLSERELTDLGMARGDIPHVARATARAR